MAAAMEGRGAGGGSTVDGATIGGGEAKAAASEKREAGPLEWGLGDAATLKAGRPPLPILPPPPPRKGPTLPTVFAPSVAREASWSGRNAPPLVQSVSAPNSMGGWSSAGDGLGWGSTDGWSTEEEGSWRGRVRGDGGGGGRGGANGAGGWSSFGLPPLVPLDHPVEPLFQVCVGAGGWCGFCDRR